MGSTSNSATKWEEGKGIDRIDRNDRIERIDNIQGLSALKDSIESASPSVKRAISAVLREHNVLPTDSTGAGLLIDMKGLDADCIEGVKAILFYESVVDGEIGPIDVASRLSPVQSVCLKKMRESIKNLSSHKRVYVEKDYGVDDAEEEEELDVPPGEDDEPEDVETPTSPPADVEEAEDGLVADPEEDETTTGLGLGLHIPEIHEEDEDDAFELKDNDELDTRDEETVNLDDATEDHGLHEEDTMTVPDEGLMDMESDTSTLGTNLLFGTMSLGQRFAHYRALLEQNIDFGDCSGLGIDVQ